MVYGPIAAFLVESFPAKIRYTSLSLPYHMGNGWFGGFTPVIATSIVAATGNRYAGLWFPIGVAAMTFVVGGFLLEGNQGSADLERGRLRRLSGGRARNQAYPTRRRPLLRLLRRVP